jgi:hypothetical protein
MTSRVLRESLSNDSQWQPMAVWNGSVALGAWASLERGGRAHEQRQADVLLVRVALVHDLQ